MSHTPCRRGGGSCRILCLSWLVIVTFCNSWEQQLPLTEMGQLFAVRRLLLSSDFPVIYTNNSVSGQGDGCLFEPCFLFFMASSVTSLHISDQRHRCASLLRCELYQLCMQNMAFFILSLSVFSILRNILIFILWLEMPGFLYLLCNNLTWEVKKEAQKPNSLITIYTLF